MKLSGTPTPPETFKKVVLAAEKPATGNPSVTIEK